MPLTIPLEYGRRIVELARAGRSITELAREFELTAETIRQWVKQAALNDGLRRANHMLRDEREVLAKAAAWFTQETGAMPNRLQVADIIYIPAWAGLLYLAVVFDAFSRQIAGWVMETYLRVELALKAGNMALE